MYDFEKLVVWQKSMDLSEEVYKLVKKLPHSEIFALSDQLKRAVNSIPLNIAEGCGTKSKKDRLRYQEIALKSLYETICALKLAERLHKVRIDEVLLKCNEVNRLLHGFIKSLSLGC